MFGEEGEEGVIVADQAGVSGDEEDCCFGGGPCSCGEGVWGYLGHWIWHGLGKGLLF